MKTAVTQRGNGKVKLRNFANGLVLASEKLGK